MKEQVVIVREGDGWRVVVDGQLIRATFNSRGAALAAVPVERRRREKRRAK